MHFSKEKSTSSAEEDIIMSLILMQEGMNRILLMQRVEE